MSDTARRSTPTEKMLQYARKVAAALGEDLPEEVEASFDACRDWLDQNAERVPPTEKQVSFAKQIAEASGEDIPDDVLASKAKLSRWLDEHAGGV